MWLFVKDIKRSMCKVFWVLSKVSHDIATHTQICYLNAQSKYSLPHLTNINVSDQTARCLIRMTHRSGLEIPIGDPVKDLDPLSLVQVLIMLMQYLLWLMIKIGEIDTSNLQQPLVASFQPPPWPQKHVHENRGIEDLAT